jgi:hypothetical protein
LGCDSNDKKSCYNKYKQKEQQKQLTYIFIQKFVITCVLSYNETRQNGKLPKTKHPEEPVQILKTIYIQER